MSSLGKRPRSGPELRIHLDGDTYIPGDTITGHVYRTAHIVSPDSSLSLSMIGTASTSYQFKDRTGAYALGIKLHHHCQTIFRGPLHIENGGHKEWAFSIPVPLYADPKVNNGIQALSYLPLDTTDHELPPSYILGDGGKERESACIQYVIEAKLTVEGHGNTEAFEAIFPFRIIQLTLDAPVADFQSRRIRYPRKISSQSLIPGSDAVRMSSLQKIRKNFSFSTDPKLVFDVFVEVPRLIQLDNPTPIPIKLLVAPDWQKTITETSSNGTFGGRRTKVDLGVVQALNELEMNLRIPFTRQWEPIDVGGLSGLRIGLQDTGFPQEWNFAQSAFTHSFFHSGYYNTPLTREFHDLMDNSSDMSHRWAGLEQAHQTKKTANFFGQLFNSLESPLEESQRSATGQTNQVPSGYLKLKVLSSARDSTPPKPPEKPRLREGKYATDRR
ncbi:hypothetical protein FGADI_9562 [Fusarium gaditjirri]|uniref:Arrestin-like N-terminal domain-containing protein n=1 Tax=Fusarium gaditjirri TaxID=282569 RepID=A0A8H4SZT3_9HYPO|nr:hypothetical protein FGADI_9562 [Fusarium gaditjirri]